MTANALHVFIECLQSPKKIRIGVLVDPFWTANATDHMQLQNVQILREAINKCEQSTNLKFIDNISADDAFNDTFRERVIEKGRNEQDTHISYICNQ